MEQARNNPKKQQLSRIIDNCIAEDMNYNTIAHHLNAKGFTSIRGKQFHRTTVIRLHKKRKK